MLRRYFDCHACACLIRGEDLTCPLCGAAQRHAGAPMWLTAVLVGGLGLADLGCDERDDSPLAHREFATTTTGIPGTTEANTTTGSTGAGTTLDSTTTTWGDGDGSTYGGPDEDSRASDPSTTSITDPTTNSTSDATTEGSTFAGSESGSTTAASTDPDASTADEPTESAPTREPTTTGADSTGGSGEEQTPDKDACACNSRARPTRGLLGLMLLGLLRRRRRS